MPIRLEPQHRKAAFHLMGKTAAFQRYVPQSTKHRGARPSTETVATQRGRRRTQPHHHDGSSPLPVTSANVSAPRPSSWGHRLHDGFRPALQERKSGGARL